MKGWVVQTTDNPPGFNSFSAVWEDGSSFDGRRWTFRKTATHSTKGRATITYTVERFDEKPLFVNARFAEVDHHFNENKKYTVELKVPFNEFKLD